VILDYYYQRKITSISKILFYDWVDLVHALLELGSTFTVLCFNFTIFVVCIDIKRFVRSFQLERVYATFSRLMLLGKKTYFNLVD